VTNSVPTKGLTKVTSSVIQMETKMATMREMMKETMMVIPMAIQ